MKKYIPLFTSVFLVIALLSLQGLAIAQADCIQTVQAAMDATQNVCNDIGRNQACYGNVILTAVPQTGVQDFTFNQKGDRVDVASIQSLKLSSMDAKTGGWGIALMDLQANLPDTLPGQNVTVVLFGDVEVQNAVPASAADLKPMQGFYFHSGADDAPCSQAPDSGILIQTPKGKLKINMQVDGVDIELGSTVYLQAQPSAALTVKVLEGQATVTAQAVTQVVPAGQEVSVPVDANLQASGAPNLPQPYSLRDIQGVSNPVGLLPLAITIATPRGGECGLTASKAINLRGGPGTNYAVTIQLQVGKNAPAKPTAQAQGSDGFTWYELRSNLWVRSDVVSSTGDCASLPVENQIPASPVPPPVTSSVPSDSGLYSYGFFYNGSCPYIDIQVNGPVSRTGHITQGQQVTFDQLPAGNYQCSFTSWVPGTGDLSCDFSVPPGNILRCVCGQGPDCQ